MSITIIGLGPGNPKLITRQVWDLLEAIDVLYLRTIQHPAVQFLPPHLKLFSFDYLYEREEKFEAVYDQIVETIINKGLLPSDVCYAVPGHPLIAEATTPEIVRRAEESGVPVQIFEGISFIEPVCNALQIDPLPNLVITDGLELASAHIPTFPTSVPVIIAQIHSIHVAAEIKLVLTAVYPDEHRVYLVHSAGTDEQNVEIVPLYMIDRSDQIGLFSTLYLPPLELSASFEQFQETIAQLRSPDGCPWDREQTHQTLRPYLLEETYEVLSSIDSNNPDSMREELGDLLLQIVLHAQIASEQGKFTMNDVISDINKKIVNRHPHVFGSLILEDSASVIQNWERIKSEERLNHEINNKGALKSVAPTLPALAQSEQYQQRAERIGFNWTDNEDFLGLFLEKFPDNDVNSIEEILKSGIGELLFYIVDLARKKGLDAESELREVNTRFKRRIEYIVSHLNSTGKVVSDLTQEELRLLWLEAKLVD